MRNFFFWIIFIGIQFLGVGQIVEPSKLPQTVTCDFPNAPLRQSPDPSSEVIGKIPRYTILNVTDYFETYLKVTYNSLEGYISYLFLKGYSPEFGTYLEYAKSLDALDLKNKLEEKENIRLQDLTKRFGEWASKRIIQKKIWVGMNEEMPLESWGKPESINRTVTLNIVSLQYVYPNYKYVYVENGKVTAWQD